MKEAEDMKADALNEARNLPFIMEEGDNQLPVSNKLLIQDMTKNDGNILLKKIQSTPS